MAISDFDLAARAAVAVQEDYMRSPPQRRKLAQGEVIAVTFDRKRGHIGASPAN